MEVLGNLALGFQVALTPYNLLFCLLGCLLGTLIGVLPGIGPLAGISILVPITFGMNPITAVITLSGLYYGAMYGGSTTSILLNVPGESASVITCLDGYQMARKGRAGPALGMAAFASFIAGTAGLFLLTITAIPLVNAALAFGPPEYFALTFLGLTLVAGLAGENMIKGFISGAFGILLSCVGVDAMSGADRFIYGEIYLMDGLGFVNVAVGLFAVAEVMCNMEQPESEVYTQSVPGIRNMLPNLQDWKDSFGALWRGSLIGFFVGALPGAGATIAAFLAYGAEKKFSKHPEKFGTGVMEGLVAPEGANNAAAQGSFVPMLTLGIPGSGVTAVLLGALMLHGMRPGPMLMKTNPDLVWGLIASMYIGNAMLVILNLPLIGIWVSFLRIPYKAIMPLIITISATGIYATENNTFDLWVMLIFGIIGYVMRKLDFPLAPVVLALVLGNLVEQSLKQSLIISSNSLAIFFTRPISATLMFLCIFSICVPLFSSTWRRLKKAGEEDL